MKRIYYNKQKLLLKLYENLMVLLTRQLLVLKSY